jgi:putative tryptophan/tyrosine transport system substrate-binding protein
MRRREFITALGSAAASWALGARAQQAAVPVVGFLTSLSPTYNERYAPAFLQGLSEAGYREHQNFVIEYRSADGQYNRLPGLVAELIGRKASLILAGGGSDPAKVARAATATIPIIFVSAADPIAAGIVTSLNRPGGNITGVSMLGSTLEAKRLGLLHEIIPGAAPIGVLVNPKYPDVDLQLRELQEAARLLKRQINIVRASSESEIDAAFVTVAQQGADALLVAQDPFFTTRREQLATLAVRHKLPGIYALREFPVAGGLMSYGASIDEAYRLAGVYAGRILKGEKPADLPVQQSTKFELVINLKAAKALGLNVSLQLQQRADEVIE